MLLDRKTDMKLKLTLIALAVGSIVGSVQAQTTPQIYITPTGRHTTVEQYQIDTVMRQIGATAAWSRGYTGKGIKIAVLDQGFDLNHADLKGNIAIYQNFYSGPIRSTNTGWGVHGTAMASAAAGKLNGGVGTVGTAYNAQLLLGQVGQGGTTPQIDTAAVIRGLNWAGKNGAVAVNMSFGASFDSTYRSGVRMLAPGVYRGHVNYTPMYGQGSSLQQYMSSTNVTSVIVAAAGNQGLAYSSYPGAFATATDAKGNLLFGGRWLIVGSVNDKNVISQFSNRAGHICNNVVNNACKDRYQVRDFYVVAPGERVAVSYDRGPVSDYLATFMNGTSPATALVTGGTALIKQAWPQLKAAEIVQLVKNTATDLGKPGVDEVYGHGLVNFDKATQPYADVKYSKVALTSGSSVSGTAINTTGMITTNSALRTSSVLKNVQIVDGINRNFTADFTRAIGASTPANSLYTSPYLAMQGLGYREFSTPAGQDSVMTFMQTNTGFASQFETGYKQGRINVQVGAMTEQDGFLNNVGTGLFSTGGSNTSYAILGGSYPVTENVDLLGNYGLGITRTRNVADSMLAVSPTLISDTWKLGFTKKEIFFNGKTRDQFTVAVHGPVNVRRGNADVTAITGYTYSGQDEDITANPVVTTERVNLASGRRQTDLIIGYSVNISNHTHAGVNLSRQFNVGGINGQSNNVVGIMIRSTF